MDTNKKEVKEKKKVKAYPEEKEKKPDVVEEPTATYGYEYYNDTRRYSYTDYLTWIDDKMREIINGIVKLMATPFRIHAKISSRIVYELETHIRRNRGKCEVYNAPFDVRLPKNGEVADDKIYTVVQPDICVVCDLSKLDERGCLGAPELVVEIQSPSTAAYDLTDKFFAYESAGVREYWVVFPKMKAITIFRLLENGKFDKGAPYEFDATVTSQVLEGLEIKLEDIFRDLS